MTGTTTIAVLGAGFGGLRAALKIDRALRRQRLADSYRIFIIDRNDHHTYTPLLYEVATTSKETADMAALHRLTAYSLREVIGTKPITLLQDEVIKIEPEAGTIHLKKDGVLKADYIVAALGSETNYFNIPGLQEHALGFKTFADALRVRDAVWNRVMEKKGCVRVVIGGGGSAGVELAGEMKLWSAQLAARFPETHVMVELIEAQPTVMCGFPERLIKHVASRLNTLGVHVHVGAKISRVETGKLQVDGGAEMDFDVLVWTGGVKTSAIVANLPYKNTSGRLEVEKGMACLPQNPDLKFSSKLYALGDAVCFHNEKTGKLVPWVARAAIIQADIVAHNIVADIITALGTAKKARRQYIPMEYPYITPVGGKYCVARLGPFIFSGMLAWVFKGLVELHYLLSIMPAKRAVSLWLKGLRVFMQNERLG